MNTGEKAFLVLLLIPVAENKKQTRITLTEKKFLFLSRIPFNNKAIIIFLCWYGKNLNLMMFSSGARLISRNVFAVPRIWLFAGRRRQPASKKMIIWISKSNVRRYIAKIPDTIGFWFCVRLTAESEGFKPNWFSVCSARLCLSCALNKLQLLLSYFLWRKGTLNIYGLCSAKKKESFCAYEIQVSSFDVFHVFSLSRGWMDGGTDGRKKNIAKNIAANDDCV